MDTKVLTAHIPLELSGKIDLFSERLDRSKGWIVKQALLAWMADEEERYQLTLSAMKQVDSGQTLNHEAVKHWVNSIDVST